MNTPRTSQGSVAMEAVLVLPIFVIIVFVILQISLVWGAKQLVAYAAYCGARAALVYNPADYDAKKQKDGHWATPSLATGGSQRGVVHFASCTALSWVSWSLTDKPRLDANATFAGTAAGMQGRDFMLGGVTAVPLSSQVRSQVRVSVTEFETIGGGKQRRGDDMDDGSAETPIERQFP
ncbi:MAG: pilus assembly protein, partial [Victivallales bacterium]|nr:pilus assembly protein [Victivallales bacterium]